MKDFEKKFSSKEKKEAKEKKKLLRKKDPEYTKAPKEINLDQMLFGVVVAIHYQHAEVQTEEEVKSCRIRAYLSNQLKQEKNALCVGDKVYIDPLEDVIVHVAPRETVLARSETLDHKKRHILAANVDQVFICTSLYHPTIKTTLIDRYLIACEMGHLTPIVLINKTDLAQTKEDDEKLKSFANIYQNLGIDVLCVSAKTQEGLEELKKKMQDKISVFSGQSGVGKSSLINQVTHHDLKTGEIVTRTKKGAHTTTTARLLPLDFGGFCVDTPGIKSFGIFDLESDQVQYYFAEIEANRNACAFTNCMHIKEDRCQIKKYVLEGKMSQERYDSYLKLVEEMRSKHKRR
ncbi:MAG: putative ribosome biogenesis GTPase RsgA [Chlamydiae bacterium]|nr:putative ribosome biogenesis GTPase RsgA [Chlamydiota bacterium]